MGEELVCKLTWGGAGAAASIPSFWAIKLVPQDRCPRTVVGASPSEHAQAELPCPDGRSEEMQTRKAPHLDCKSV